MSTIEHSDSSTPSPAGQFSVETEEVLHRLFERVYSEGDLTVAGDVVATDFEGRCSGTTEPFHGIAGVKEHASRLRSAFVGLTVEIDDLRRTPEGFQARLTAEGRFERPFAGVEPTCVIGRAGEEPRGPTVTIAGDVSGRVTGGALSGFDIEWDIDALRNQN